jgi:hypothetical protein
LRCILPQDAYPIVFSWITIIRYNPPRHIPHDPSHELPRISHSRNKIISLLLLFHLLSSFLHFLFLHFSSPLSTSPLFSSIHFSPLSTSLLFSLLLPSPVSAKWEFKIPVGKDESRFIVCPCSGTLCAGKPFYLQLHYYIEEGFCGQNER